MVAIMSLTALAILVIFTALQPALAGRSQSSGSLLWQPASDEAHRAAGRLLSVNWNGDDGHKKSVRS